MITPAVALTAMHLTSAASFHRRSVTDQTLHGSLISCGVWASLLTWSQPRAWPNSSSFPTYHVGVPSDAKQNHSMWLVLLSFLYAGRPWRVPPVRVYSPSLSWCICTSLTSGVDPASSTPKSVGDSCDVISSLGGKTDGAPRCCAGVGKSGEG